MGFFRKLFGREDAATVDARRIYAKLMRQSRDPEFYGEGRFNDDYDGRIDVLTLHIAAILSNLNRFGTQGERLGQALFDEMKDDFEIALREEALSDASVKKRIQPMISLFYDRVKRYAESLHANENDLETVFQSTLPESASAFAKPISDYVSNFDTACSDLSLGQIAMAEFAFPDLPKSS